MLSLPQKTLDKIKQTLLRQQREVDDQIKSIESDDPVSASGLVAEASEPGTDSWLAEAHGRLLALKGDLLGLSVKIKNSLIRMGSGTYGKCERCGKPIEAARLKAMPTATLCLLCSSRKNK